MYKEDFCVEFNDVMILVEPNKISAVTVEESASNHSTVYRHGKVPKHGKCVPYDVKEIIRKLKMDICTTLMFCTFVILSQSFRVDQWTGEKFWIFSLRAKKNSLWETF